MYIIGYEHLELVGTINTKQVCTRVSVPGSEKWVTGEGRRIQGRHGRLGP